MCSINTTSESVNSHLSMPVQLLIFHFELICFDHDICIRLQTQFSYKADHLFSERSAANCTKFGKDFGQSSMLCISAFYFRQNDRRQRSKIVEFLTSCEMLGSDRSHWSEWIYQI